MYQVALIPTLAFILAGTFSPGPNNVMSASLGVSHGFRRTLPFLLGITCGFTVVMLICAVASAVLLRLVPSVEPVLRWLGAAYILWLAWSTWVHREGFGGSSDGAEAPPVHGFGTGFLLQFANVKALVYGLTMYATFLASLSGHAVALGLSALVLAAVGFTAISTWALGGVAIRSWLKSARDRAIVAGVLSLTLVYTAFELADIGRIFAR